MIWSIQAAGAVAARLVAAALMIGAAACSATAWSAGGFWFLALGAAAIDATSPFLWTRQNRTARIACWAAIMLSASSIWVVLSDVTAKPLARAAVAEGTAGDADADLKLLREQIAAWPADQARHAAATAAARDSATAAKASAERKAARAAELLALRDAPEACDGGRNAPNDSNPKCQARTAEHATAAAEAAAMAATIASADDALALAMTAEADALAAHTKREARLEKAGERKDDAGEQSTGGAYAFRWLAQNTGASSETVAVIVSAVFAMALSMMATVAPGALIAAAPLPKAASKPRRRGSDAAAQPEAAAQTGPAEDAARPAPQGRRTPAEKAQLAAEARKLIAGGVSKREAARRLGVPRQTLERYMAARPALAVVGASSVS